MRNIGDMVILFSDENNPREIVGIEDVDGNILYIVQDEFGWILKGHDPIIEISNINRSLVGKRLWYIGEGDILSET